MLIKTGIAVIAVGMLAMGNSYAAERSTPGSSKVKPSVAPQGKAQDMSASGSMQKFQLQDSMARRQTGATTQSNVMRRKDQGKKGMIRKLQ